MTYRNRYGHLDRLLHRIAFRSGTTQRALADVEDLWFRESLDALSLDEPVFVTALPRSGTTILLKVLWETDRFATHLYRDMPFVLCPILWERFSRNFAVDDRRHERAHGDGLEISGESPEGFEEMIWKQFWPDHYEEHRILPWTSSESYPDFDGFLDRHMRKIIVLRREGPSDRRRYLSKNNVNVARLGASPRPMKSGVFLVPFRDPVQQAASMLRQHRRFTRLQDEDDFLRRYMDAIGHHEFGRGLRPVDFGGWLDDAPRPDDLEFWLRYWIAAYGHVLANGGPSTHVVWYRRLTDEPGRALASLSEVIGIPADELESQAGRLHPPRLHEVDTDPVDDRVLGKASELRDQLERESVIG